MRSADKKKRKRAGNKIIYTNNNDNFRGAKTRE